MTALHFTGNLRTAAQTILNDTPLGYSMSTLGAIEDDGTRLTIRDDDSVVAYLSSGEALLLGFLDNLARGHLHRLLDRVDTDCQAAVVQAVAQACGFEVDVHGPCWCGGQMVCPQHVGQEVPC